jgi:hypothetical protein
VWPEAADRVSKLNAARDRITAFRKNYLPYLELNAKARAVLGLPGVRDYSDQGSG